ncbi:MAG: site-specific integrase [Solirubrobacteraceae bacterium]
MPRPATGQVIVDKRRKSPTYALRFNASGGRQYVALGSSEEGWTRARAQDELERELARVKLGTWEPPKPAEPAPAVEQDPTFHEFASQWFEASRGEWRETTRLDYEWQLSHHLLPFFKNHRLSQVTIAEVDRYRAAKVKQGTLSATSINKTITRLGQILEVAVEYGLIERNPARGKRRRLRASRPAAVWLDSAEQIDALLAAAGELDSKAKANGQVPRRAILATLTFAGLRIGELIDLRWRDVNLADGRITIRASKTNAGVRTVDLLPALRDELLALKARTDAPANARVFPTQAAGPMNPSNVRNRILTPAAKLASERLEQAGGTPLPAGLTPHKLRHTFASILVALGVDPGAVMDQLGHTDPTFTLRVYRHGMRRDPASKAALGTLVGRLEALDQATAEDRSRMPAVG